MRQTRREILKAAGAGAAAAILVGALPEGAFAAGPSRPNIVLAMTDDQGWGDVGYNGHPVLKTPNLDAMAAAGLRLDRFHSAAPVCSPTRGSVLTGRHPNRFGCFSHGFPLRPQELTIARILKDAGYVTGHFGKWHLNGKSGPGAPVLAEDPLHPGRFGFDAWVSVSNYFDIDGGFGRQGKPEAFTGDSSDVTMEEAIKFIRQCAAEGKPFFAVVWYGSPHGPHKALDADRKPYQKEAENAQHYYGELAAVDRSIGRLRKELRDLKVADNTLVWFCSDNGGAQGELSTGGLRGKKGTLWEGGLRVPGIIEWPARTREGRRASMPAGTVDIFPTLLDALNLKPARVVEPLDGVSLAALFAGPVEKRPAPLMFWQDAHAAILDNNWKLHRLGANDNPTIELYDLAEDDKESRNIAADRPEIAARLRKQLEQWMQSVRQSQEGKDYPEGKLTSPDPGRKRLSEDEMNWRNKL